MIDFEKLKHVFPFFQELSTDDVFNFLEHTRIVKLNAGDIFLKQGSRKSNIYFVKQGLIRSFLVNEKGEEITNRIRYENQAMSCYEIDMLNEPSRFNLQALEPTELIVMDVKTMQQIVHGNPKLEPGLRFFVNSSLVEALSAVDDFMLLSAEQRYLKFIKEHPELLNRIPNKYIANVLGITPQSLSRIRKRIATKKQ